MKKEERELIKNSSILTFGTLCTKGLMFIMTPFLIRWLTQSDYGTFDIVINYVTLLIPVITLDIGEAVFRFLVDVDDDFSESIISTALLSELVELIAGTFVLTVLNLFLPAYQNLFTCFFIVLVAEGAYTFFGMIMRGLKKLPLYSVANILYVVSMIISSILFVGVLHLGLNGIFYSYAIGYAVSTIYMGTVCRINRFFSWHKFEWKTYKKMLAYSVPLIPNAVAWWVVNISDRTIVSLFLGVEANAVLAVTHKLPNLCQTLFSRFHLSWQQSASETINSEGRDSFYSSVLNVLINMMASLILFLLSINILFFRVLYTEEYFTGYYITPILLVAMLVYMVAQFLGGINIAKMESCKNGATTVFGAIVNIAVHLIFIRLIGLYAAVISTFVAYIVILLIRYIDIRKEIKLRLEKSSYIILLLLLYFFIENYVGNDLFHYINIVFALIICFVANKHLIKLFAKKVGGNIMKKFGGNRT